MMQNCCMLGIVHRDFKYGGYENGTCFMLAIEQGGSRQSTTRIIPMKSTLCPFICKLKWVYKGWTGTDYKIHMIYWHNEAQRYFWFKYDLGQKYHAPKVRPDGVRTHDLQIMTVLFMSLETPALSTRPSVTGMHRHGRRTVNGNFKRVTQLNRNGVNVYRVIITINSDS